MEVIFSNKNNKEVVANQLVFNNIPVKTVPETKHVGMTLDEKLNFDSHIVEKNSKS